MSRPRLLFVVTGSYGDLALALSFVTRQAMAAEAAFALPAKLYELNDGTLQFPAYVYRSVKDITRIAGEWGARLVLMFSAYGLPVEGVASPSRVRALVRRLRGTGCEVVTTDPFLGSAAEIQATQIEQMLPAQPGWQWRVRRKSRRFARALGEVSGALADVVHLYPTPVSNLPHDGRIARVSFFNAAFATLREDGQPVPELQSVEPIWLILLSDSDWALQQRKSGSDQFSRQLVRLFVQALRAHRIPVFIGPAPLVHRLKSALPAELSAVQLLSFCPHREFMARLVEAEYAFCWNAFSCSIVMRMENCLPAFVFDRGHVAQFSPRIYEDGLRCYFDGWEPEPLDPDGLDLKSLAEKAERQKQNMARIRRYWEQSPTPDQVVESLLPA